MMKTLKELKVLQVYAELHDKCLKQHDGSFQLYSYRVKFNHEAHNNICLNLQFEVHNSL